MDGQERDGWMDGEREMRKRQMDEWREREMREKWTNEKEKEIDG